MHIVDFVCVVDLCLLLLSKITFLQRYAKHCISYRKSLCLTVCHTLVSSQNDLSYDHGVFTGG